MQELMPINIIVADRSYRIKITPEDEEDVRGRLKTINEKVVEFKTQFAGKDMQDYIAMVLLWFATQPKESGILSPSADSIRTSLEKMEQSLDSVL